MRQYDWAVRFIESALGHPFRLELDLLLELNRLAVEGVELEAGKLREGDVVIENAPHRPPPWKEVAGHVEAMIQFVNDHWDELDAIPLASYLLWRVNWIHPFMEGNGRTARMLSYVVLNVRLGYLLPGTNTIPEQIASERGPYYLALDAADAAWKESRLDTSVMEAMLEEMLAAQLIEVLNKAAGRDCTGNGC